MRVLRGDSHGDTVRYLRADGIKHQIEEVQAGLRHGRLFAGYGAGALFPVEEHVALLATIEKLYQSVLSGNEARVEERTHFEDREVDVVVRRRARDAQGARGRPRRDRAHRRPGVRPRADDRVDARRACRSFPPSRRRTGRAGAEVDPELERWRVHDLSSRGYGLIVDHAAADAIPLNGLIALANHETGGWIVGSVVRKRPSRVRGEVLAGVEVLSTGRSRWSSRRARRRAVAALYLPGTDTSGKHDSLVVRRAIRLGPRLRAPHRRTASSACG